MIFIDTGAFLARYLPRDQYHKTALSLWDKLREENQPCVTSNFVLDETLTLLARRASYSFAVEKAKIIYSSRSLQILRPEALTKLDALNWFEKFADQGISFTDCISFSLMKAAGIKLAFSFDAHFDRAGFKRCK